jgi:hypothetical protein
MKIVRLFAALAALATTVLLFAAPASAQATRTWVSGVGDDANPCSRTAPCKTFAGAISKTAAAGEINCLDPGGFGALTITKAITISCETGTAGVLVSGTNGFVVAAGTTDAVILKGLDFNGIGPTGGALDGVKVQSAATVLIDHCIIYGFGSTNGVDGNGVFVNNTNSVQVTIQDTLISNNANGGVWIKPTGSSNAMVLINNSQIVTNNFGIVADGTGTTGKVNGSVRDSTVTGNNQNGITASNSTAANDTLLLNNVSVVNNGNNGLASSGSGAGLLVGNSTIYGNHAGIVVQNSSAIDSYGNNQLNGNNGADGSFTATLSLH